MPRGLPGPEPCARALRWYLGALPRASALAQFRAALGDRGLAVRGLVLVDDALARGLVQALRRHAHRHGRGLGVARVGRLAELAHRGLQRRLDCLVALPGLLVLLVALDLGLDIRHAYASLRFVRWSECARREPMARWRARRSRCGHANKKNIRDRAVGSNQSRSPPARPAHLPHATSARRAAMPRIIV